MELAASSACGRVFATTAATGVPTQCTAPRASTGWGGIFIFGSTCDDDRFNFSLMSLPVITASTPGIVLALPTSMERILACG